MYVYIYIYIYMYISLLMRRSTIMHHDFYILLIRRYTIRHHDFYTLLIRRSASHRAGDSSCFASARSGRAIRVHAHVYIRRLSKRGMAKTQSKQTYEGISTGWNTGSVRTSTCLVSDLRRRRSWVLRTGGRS